MNLFWKEWYGDYHLKKLVIQRISVDELLGLMYINLYNYNGLNVLLNTFLYKKRIYFIE